MDGLARHQGKLQIAKAAPSSRFLPALYRHTFCSQRFLFPPALCAHSGGRAPLATWRVQTATRRCIFRSGRSACSMSDASRDHAVRIASAYSLSVEYLWASSIDDLEVRSPLIHGANQKMLEPAHGHYRRF